MESFDWSGWNNSAGTETLQELLEKNRPIYERAKERMEGTDGSENKEKARTFDQVKEIVQRFHNGTVRSAEYALGVIYQMFQEADAARLRVIEYETKMQLYKSACKREDAIKMANTANP